MSITIETAARERNLKLIAEEKERVIDLEPKFLVQMAHLTTPATVAKYVETAATKSAANLVMLDLEDSIPRGNEELLKQGRDNVVHAVNDLDWGRRLRFFRPRGLALDPGHTDIIDVVTRCGAKLDGLIYPKTESAAEVVSIDHTLSSLERRTVCRRGRSRSRCSSRARTPRSRCSRSRARVSGSWGSSSARSTTGDRSAWSAFRTGPTTRSSITRARGS